MEPTNRPGNEIIGELLGGLQHAKYDPVKAHAYYERTKKLKGRRAGSGDNVVPIARGRHTTPDKKTPSHHQVSPALQARIQHLEKRLNDLRDHLRKLLASKQKKAGPATKSQHQTTADKQKKAASNKKYQQQHKSELAQKRKSASKSGSGGGSKSSSGVSSMTEAQLRSAIKTTQANLHEAVAKARASANRGTA